MVKKKKSQVDGRDFILPAMLRYYFATCDRPGPPRYFVFEPHAHRGTRRAIYKKTERRTIVDLGPPGPPTVRRALLCSFTYCYSPAPDLLLRGSAKRERHESSLLRMRWFSETILST